MSDNTHHYPHPATWWAQFGQTPDTLDPASITEALSEVILPKIPSALLRREAERATEVVLRSLNSPASEPAAEKAKKVASRLAGTVDRLNERSTAEDAGTTAAYALTHLLQGDWSAAASEIEPLVGRTTLLRAFISALRLEEFNSTLTLRLIDAGHTPATAIRSSLAIRRYNWWPSWLLKIVTDRALAGTLDAPTIAALQKCAYAGLSPTQAKMAGRLFNAEPQMVEATAYRLEALGEYDTATRLRSGDMTTVAFAARLIPV